MIVRPSKIDQELASLGGLVERLNWLIEHRLAGPVDLLERRNLVQRDLASLARSLLVKKPAVSHGQIAEEQRVFARFVQSGVRALALKGCLVAYLCYPLPNQRNRADLDILIAPGELKQARDTLLSLGYRLSFSVPGGTPSKQESWSCRLGDDCQVVDLHWAIRNHPLLRDRLQFEEQWSRSVELPDLAPGARGQCRMHALLNASMHWYDSIYHEPSPYGWLLDIDLLWRSIDGPEVDELVELAEERGLSGLLGQSLSLAKKAFSTPVPIVVIRELEVSGKSQRPTRLIGLVGHRFKSYLFSLACEPGLRAKMRRASATFFPPATYMRQRYSAQSNIELAQAYFRRAWKRIRGNY